MQRVRAVFVVLVSLIALRAAFAADAPPVTLTVTAERPQLVNQESMTLVLSLKSASFGGGNVNITVPSECTATPKTVAVLPFTDLYETAKITVTCSNSEGTKTARAQLVRTTPSPDTVAASGSVSFEYVHRISVGLYLLLGCAGIFVGYLLRIVMQVQRDIGPSPIPLVDNEEPNAPGPITIFVKAHYYLVDLAVAETLGLLSMVLLLKSGHVPDTSTHWYEALVLGVGLGLLANTDLVLRVRPKV